MRIALTLIAALIPAPAFAGYIDFTGSYSQNFNSLPHDSNGGTKKDTFMPYGWSFFETGPFQDNQYSIGPQGSNNTIEADTWNFGYGQDRAIGTMTEPAQFGTVPTNSFIRADFVNNTGSALQSLTLSYQGEQWWNKNGTDYLTFGYIYFNNQLQDAPGLYFHSILDEVNGADPHDRGQQVNGDRYNTIISGTITFDTPINPGEKFTLQWSGSGLGRDGLAIDDVSVTGTPVSPVPEPSSLMLLAAGTAALGIRRFWN